MCFGPLKESREHLNVAIYGLVRNLSLTRQLDRFYQGQPFQGCLDLPVRWQVMQHLFDFVGVLLGDRLQ